MLFLPEGLQEQDNLEAQIDLLPKLTPNILRTWAKDYYGSGNTVISITGSFNKNKLLKKLKISSKKNHNQESDLIIKISLKLVLMLNIFRTKI